MRATWVVLAALLAASEVGAAQAAAPATGSRQYASKEACETALAAGAAAYVPSAMSGHKPLAAGERRALLPARQCGEMKTILRSRTWVIQDAETEFVWSPGDVVIRRWDCGNDAWSFSLAPTPAPPDATQWIELSATAPVTVTVTQTVTAPPVVLAAPTATAPAAANFPDPGAFRVHQSSDWLKWTAGGVVVGGALAGIARHNHWFGWGESSSPPPAPTGRPPGDGGPGPVFVIFGVPVTIGR